MRRRILIATGGVLLSAVPTLILSAQPNPFKVPKPLIRGASVAYAMSGDMEGTATVALDGDRYVRTSQGTMKIFGKATATHDWQLVTPDSMWHADLTKKQGFVSPNVLSHLAKAYDGLDGAGKKRLHQNVQDLGSMLSGMVGLGNVLSGERIGKKTYAGQECEERRFGSFTVCQMEKTPIVLHTAGSLVCMKFEETATEVSLAPPGAAAFAAPEGVSFKPNPHFQNPDSVAQGFVGYLASEALSDSLAKAKAEMAKYQAEGGGAAAQPNAEQQASMQAACEMLKSVDMGQVMADASAAWKQAMAEALKNEAKSQAARGLKGLVRKPRIP